MYMRIPLRRSLSVSLRMASMRSGSWIWRMSTVIAVVPIRGSFSASLPLSACPGSGSALAVIPVRSAACANTVHTSQCPTISVSMSREGRVSAWPSRAAVPSRRTSTASRSLSVRATSRSRSANRSSHSCSYGFGAIGTSGALSAASIIVDSSACCEARLPAVPGRLRSPICHSYSWFVVDSALLRHWFHSRLSLPPAIRLATSSAMRIASRRPR